ncbi:transglutaminase family protein [Okibacterium fritillariae]|uniref:Transglutaminase-like enzyme, putative cysteine protease n=1 Tax=Okibacterium fritillariae TaxID=123320 RepID=A0A1T5IMN3_9MICO|nr:transglutaminase family protein [Okibacterium fritillariae]SKC40436.1 Transglutaminase-like enzyme, putative cysteine protease [Okibacterium fritillariae]
MKRLRIVHKTGFSYQGQVKASYNEARMLPSTTDGQFVLSSTIEIQPTASQHAYVDYFGTRVTAFELLTPHQELSLQASSLVEVRPRAHAEASTSWDDLPGIAGLRLETQEQTAQTRRTEPSEDLMELARDIAEKHDNPCEAASEIARTIGEQMEYVQGVTSVHTSAAEAWADRRGVCQDITHIVLGALRSVGIPARYVSGYLHPKPNAEIGETVVGESHAWVEWFCGSWHGFDPTNMLDIGDRHVLVGRGRDYQDVAPLRGVYAGPFRSSLFVSVEITREA